MWLHRLPVRKSLKKGRNWTAPAPAIPPDYVISGNYPTRRLASAEPSLNLPQTFPAFSSSFVYTLASMQHLSSGAGGAVHIIHGSDGAHIAAQEFGPKRSSNSNKEYRTKLTADFCVI